MSEEISMSREITLSKAVNEAIAEEMRRDPTIFLIGEDVAEAGTPFKVLAGLVEEFGTERIIDTPISEPGFMGMAVGAAMTGSRPIVDLMFGDFLFLVMDQLCNQAAKTHYMSGGKLKRAAGAAHQSRRDPAFRRPAFAVAARARGAYPRAEGRPALLGLRSQGPDEDGDPRRQSGRHLRRQADVQRQGAGAGGGISDPLRRGGGSARGPRRHAGRDFLDGAGLPQGRRACWRRDGISAEIIDPRTIVPLDEDTIVASAQDQPCHRHRRGTPELRCHG
jgi:hypothetical protein